MSFETSPRVSVLLPVYNGEAYLREALDSILHQTFTDFEVIVLDDGSTDGTADILASYDDPRIRVIRFEENRGLARNLNTGIEEAAGEYIARMDADDISMPERFRRQVAFLDENPDVAVCGTWIQNFGANENVLRDPVEHERLYPRFMFYCPIKHPSVMMRRKVLVDEGFRYDPAFDRAEDYDMWVRIGRTHRLGNVPEVLLKYRMHPGAVSIRSMGENTRQAWLISLRMLDWLGVRPSRREYRLHALIARRLGMPQLPFRRILVRLWLRKLRIANEHSNMFEHEGLQHAFNEVRAATRRRFTLLALKRNRMMLKRHPYVARGVTLEHPHGEDSATGIGS